MRIAPLLVCALAWAPASQAASQTASQSPSQPPSPAAQRTLVGPERGSLVIVGGALTDTTIVRAFLDLAGGADKPIVIVPTAGEDDDYGESNSGLGMFQALGATNLRVLHTRSAEEADTEAFVGPLLDAAGVWFVGGRQWRLAQSYLGTRTEREVRGVLERGGVVGGSSAGASIIGSYLVRGDTNSNTIMMGDHEEGFGLLRDSAIDQHLLARNRQFDLLEVVGRHPHLLGIGIDENTAVVVNGDGFDVIGRGYVAIYDHRAMLDSGGLFYFLSPGDHFNLASREAFRPVGRTLQPLGRVVRQPWPGGR